MLAKPATRPHCYICGSIENLTDDHLPPEGFFPPKQAHDLITAPLCESCHRPLAKDDEVMRMWLSSHAAASPAGKWIFKHKVVASTIARNQKLFDNIQRYLKPLPSGAFFRSRMGSELSIDTNYDGVHSLPQWPGRCVSSIRAIYHVLSRGDRREAIVRSDSDRKLFLDLLAHTCRRTGWQIHAYCLLDNHFHLVVETPRSNLSAGMQWLLGSYTQRFNRRHGLWGHLFGGRYKALLVDGRPGRAYLRRVCDYVHLNPVRAGMLSDKEKVHRYRWSSCGESPHGNLDACIQSALPLC